MKNWKRAIAEGLHKHGMSARALCRAANLSSSTVHDMINTEGFAPQIDSLEKVFEALGGTIDFQLDEPVMAKAYNYLTKTRNWENVSLSSLGQIVKLAGTVGDWGHCKALLNDIKTQDKFETFIESMKDEKS